MPRPIERQRGGADRGEISRRFHLYGLYGGAVSDDVRRLLCPARDGVAREVDACTAGGDGECRAFARRKRVVQDGDVMQAACNADLIFGVAATSRRAARYAPVNACNAGLLFGGAATVGADSVGFDPYPVAALHRGTPKGDALQLVADDPVPANQMIRIPLPDGYARRAVGFQPVLRADRVRGAQAVEDAEAAVVMNRVALHDVAHRAAAGMQAASGVVVKVAAADKNVGALLETDRVPVVMPHLDAFKPHAPALKQKHAPTPAAVERARLLRVAVEREVFHRCLRNVPALNQREQARHPPIVRGMVIVVEHPINKEEVPLTRDDRGYRVIEAVRVVVVDMDAHADAERLRLGHSELVMAVADIVEQGAGDAGNLLQHRPRLPHQAHSVAQM